MIQNISNKEEMKSMVMDTISIIVSNLRRKLLCVKVGEDATKPLIGGRELK